jgi:hypothetical protein
MIDRHIPDGRRRPSGILEAHEALKILRFLTLGETVSEPRTSAWQSRLLHDARNTEKPASGLP